MKKISTILGMFFIAITSLSAQLVIDAEMFKANPNSFMGKTVTIKNVVFKNVSQTVGSPTTGVVSVPSGNVGTQSGAPVGIAGPSSGKSAQVYCNPQPKFTLTKWVLGPNNELCVQVDGKMQPVLGMLEPGKVVKSITFRVTPTMYLATRIEP
jgi:hypothetical protein